MGELEQSQTEEQNQETEPKEGEQPTEELAPQEQQEETTEENEAEKPESDGENTDEEPTAKAAEEKPEEKHRRAGGWQRKIERLEREKEALYQQLSQRHGQPPPPAPDKPADPAAQVQEYVNGLVEQRLQAREAQAQQTRVQAEFQRRTAEFAARTPDFDDVVLSADLPVSAALSQAILTSEHAPAIMYQLAKNPSELARISALPALDAAREIGRLEAKASVTPPPATQPKSSAIRPPVPPTSLGGSKASTRNLDDLPLADYKRAMRGKR